MGTPKTLNARIARAKGWQPVQIPTSFSLSPSRHTIEKWQPPNPRASLVDKKDLPDYVGTLKGVAELMRELEGATDEYGQPHWYSWGYNIYTHHYVCLEYTTEIARSPDDRPGDCVGAAYLSVFGKEGDAWAGGDSSDCP